VILSHHQNSGQNQNIRIVNESFENVAKFKYLGTTLTNKNDIHDEIKSRFNLGNACYYSVQNLLYSRLISKTPKIKIHKTVTSPAALPDLGFKSADNSSFPSLLQSSQSS
jgi:hypothetical protein